MIIDAFIVNNEIDLVKLHMSVLDPVVDHFLIVEGDQTFSGKSKPMYVLQDQEIYDRWHRKTTLVETYLSRESFRNRWEVESYQRNRIMHGLLEINPMGNDLVLISDVDEIANPDVLVLYKDQPPTRTFAFDTYCYYYYLNLLMSPEPTSSRCIVGAPVQTVINMTPQKLREMRLSVPLAPLKGWHFSFMGGIDRIIDKIGSFSHAEYDNPHFKDPERLQQAISLQVDLFERGGIHFTQVPIAYPTHPQWLVDHQGEYQSYIRKGE